MEEQRGKQDDQHGAGIINERPQTHIQQPVRTEQSYPVQAERNPAQQQRHKLGLNTLPVKAPLEGNKNRQNKAADQCTEQHNMAAGDGDIGNIETIRPEQKEGKNEHDIIEASVVCLCLHIFSPLLCCEPVSRFVFSL